MRATLFQIDNCCQQSPKILISPNVPSVHIERVLQRIKFFRILKGTFGRNLLVQSDKILTFIRGLVNLQAPIIKSDEILQ